MTQCAWSDACLAQVSVRTQEYQEAAALALTHGDREGAGRQASRLIERQNAAEELGPLAGLSCTIKACFDVEGWTTHAGSVALLGAPAAQQDAARVSRLRQSAALILAPTTMPEFTYGEFGL